MQTVLFHETVFGPIHSRRLGASLGVNLSPRDGKICSFDCLYCEAGFNAQGPGTTGFPSRQEVARLLEARLKELREGSKPLDVITFSGNGEPTVHPEFDKIVDDTLALRDKYFPDVKISVLTNGTMAWKPEVAEALKRVDNNIAKLDSAIEETVQTLDRPNSKGYSAAKAIEWLAAFEGRVIVQTMITRGSHDGTSADNTCDKEIEALIEAYKKIKPSSIMIYSLDRQTPEHSLEKIPMEQLREIGARIEAATGIPVSVA